MLAATVSNIVISSDQRSASFRVNDASSTSLPIDVLSYQPDGGFTGTDSIQTTSWVTDHPNGMFFTCSFC